MSEATEAAGGRIVRFAANPHGRDFAVGDIHGAFPALDAALTTIRFDRRKDRLFSVGDLVDRGPASHTVTDWLDQPWFHAVCGNHDFMTWRSALGQPFGPVDHLAHGGQWLAALPPAEQRRIGKLLARLPMALEVETAAGLVGIVHADLPSDDWHDLAHIDWSGLERMRSAAGQCLWSIDRFRYRHEGLVANIRAVVHGHQRVPAAQTLGNAHFIETRGWHPEGHFSFLDLHSLQVITGPRPTPTAVPRKRYR